MEQFNAAHAALTMAAKHLGCWAGHVSHVPMAEVVAGLEFDQQAEVIVAGLRVTAHSQSGHTWPVYVQVHGIDGTAHRVVGYYTPEGLSSIVDDIIRYTNIPS